MLCRFRMALFRPSSSLRRRASCCVCLDQYDGKDHVPKFLPCQHSVCSSCLTNLPRDGSKISCPQCRAKHKVPSGGFPTNRGVLDIVGELPKHNESGTAMKCKNHGSTNCVLVCMYCLEGLCPKCMKENQRNPRNPHARHTLEEPDEAQAKLSAKLDTALKTKQMALTTTQSNFSGCPSDNQIDKAKRELQNICSGLRKILSDWESAQQSHIDSWKSDAETEAAKFESAENALKDIRPTSDLGDIVYNLNRLDTIAVSGGYIPFDLGEGLKCLKRHLNLFIDKHVTSPRDDPSIAHLLRISRCTMPPRRYLMAKIVEKE